MMEKAGYGRQMVKYTAVFMFLLALGCEGAQGDGLGSANAGEEAISTSGIIGGSPTNGATRWNGVVGLSNRRSTCTGTLIDPEIVLTAGHCVLLNDESGYFDTTSNPSALRIVVGGDMGYNGTAVALGWEIITHPTWTGDLAAGATDLALVRLDRPVDYVSTFPLRDFPMPKDGQSAYLVGYGNNGYGESGVQREGATTIWTVTPAELETGGNANTCPGDSGGPVLTKQGGNWAVAGVNSYGAGAVCSTEKGMWAVNTLSQCHWLNDTMMDLVGRDLGLKHCTSCKASKVSNWGQACGPGFSACPKGTECMKPDGFSVDGGGFCAAPCCDLGAADPRYCSNVANGEEMCGLQDDYGKNYCVVQCRTDADCPEDTTCRNRPFESEKFCIAKGITETPEPEEEETETTEDREDRAESDDVSDDDRFEDSEETEDDPDEGESDEDGDEEDEPGSDEDGSSESDTDTEAQWNSSGSNGSSGWGCSLFGAPGSHRWFGLFGWLFSL